MSYCPNDLNFSSTHAQKRQEKAHKLMGESVVNRILTFALFLLGGNREKIGQYLGMPMGTLLSFLTRINAYGLSALEDRRASLAKNLQQEITKLPKCCVNIQKKNVCIQFGNIEPVIEIPKVNQLQIKTVLLTFLRSGLLSTSEVAIALGLSDRRIRDLSTGMYEQDIEMLIDKRIGQQQDYRFDPETKSELVQQFAVNAISGQSTSSRVLANSIKERCSLTLADRSIRLYVQKLGLYKIKKTLPELVRKLKKNS